MKQLLIALSIFCITTSLHSAQHVMILPQEHEQKPTHWELERYWTAKYTGDQIVFDLVAKYGKNIINETDTDLIKYPMLVYAAEDNPRWTLEKFEKLLKTPGIDIYASGNWGTCDALTHAMFTTKDGDPNEVQLQKIALLLYHGVDPDRAAPFRNKPLLIAAEDNQPKVVSMLLAAGASPDVYMTQGGDAGRTFFDIAKEFPAVQQAYVAYLKEVHATMAEALSIKDLVRIVASYLFTPSPIDQEVFNVALAEHEKNTRCQKNGCFPGCSCP